MDVPSEIAAILNKRNEPLPEGALEWLEAHSAAARRFLRDVLELRDNQYIEYRMRVVSEVWAGDFDGAKEAAIRELDQSVGDWRVRWTGKWRVATVDPDVWAWIHRMRLRRGCDRT